MPAVPLFYMTQLLRSSYMHSVVSGRGSGVFKTHAKSLLLFCLSKQIGMVGDDGAIHIHTQGGATLGHRLM